MSQVLQQVRLSDGSTAQVDSRTAKILQALHGVEQELVAGVIGSLFVVRVTKSTFDPSPKQVESLLGFFEHDGLQDLSQEMFKESRRAQGIASLWEGTAPASNRSFEKQ